MKFLVNLLKRLAGEDFVVVDADRYRKLRILEIAERQENEALDRALEIARSQPPTIDQLQDRVLKKRETDRLRKQLAPEIMPRPVRGTFGWNTSPPCSPAYLFSLRNQ